MVMPVTISDNLDLNVLSNFSKLVERNLSGGSSKLRLSDSLTDCVWIVAPGLSQRGNHNLEGRVSRSRYHIHLVSREFFIL